MKKRLFSCLMALMISATSINAFLPALTFASGGGGDCTTLLKDSWCDMEDGGGIMEIVKMVVNIMTAGVIVVGTIGIIWCGFLILSARDNEAQVAQAKKRLIDIVIGMAVFGLAGLLIGLLLPGGNQSGINLGF